MYFCKEISFLKHFLFPDFSTINGSLLGMPQGRSIFSVTVLCPWTEASGELQSQDQSGRLCGGRPRGVDTELSFWLLRNQWEHCFGSQSSSFSLAVQERNKEDRSGAFNLWPWPCACHPPKPIASCNPQLNQRKSIRRFLFTLQCVSPTSMPLMELGIDLFF